MRFARYAWLFYQFFLVVPIWGQQAQPPVIQPQPTAPMQTQPVTTLPPVTKDAQAVSIVTQALAAAGGIPAITGITDYMGTGNITYRLGVDQGVQGSVSVRGKGLAQFRLDAKLPSACAPRPQMRSRR
jgi:hypothetical protein